VKGSMKHVFAICMRELKASGYTVKCQLMDAAYFGVPQHRQRVIFIGVRNDLALAPSHPVAQTQIITLKEATDGIVNPAEILEASYYPVSSACYRLLIKMKAGERGSQYHPRGSYFSLKRLRWDRPSRTVLHEDGGGAACQCCHPTEMRRLTIPEVRRVQSFPDTFQFIGDVGEQWARIGNSVPPKFMQAIAAHVYATVLHPAQTASAPAATSE